ncbi:hypothetical protein C8Q72DRAFT_871398 [Fomitopsis betulina]|nr:hypothetical protein C8Q72DRAFT_871697 [Fomitopsis betulina]KAI0709621.1 hypothetical protein C8Q72DRAFT_871398 [Fomitopsis betulina]
MFADAASGSSRACWHTHLLTVSLELATHISMATDTPQPDLSNDEDLGRLESLDKWELTWIRRQPWLQSHGYMLRPRYRPGLWIPDSSYWPLQIRYTHATRMSEGKLVAIRSVQTDGLEIRIAMFLGTPPLSEDPANHCVRILDTFEDETDPSTSYIVIPFLRRYDDPVFESVEDVVDFGEQAH